MGGSDGGAEGSVAVEDAGPGFAALGGITKEFFVTTGTPPEGENDVGDFCPDAGEVECGGVDAAGGGAGSWSVGGGESAVAVLVV